MKANLILKSADARSAKTRRDQLESYFSPLGEIEIQCSTGEREEFEADEARLPAVDVLPAKQFCALAVWLFESAKLKPFAIECR